MKVSPETGKLLVAEPFLHDPTFKRSVVLLTEHSNEGSLGFILNKPTNVTVQELIPDFPEFEANVFLGGPVEQDRLNYIHTLGERLEGSIEIFDGIYWGGDFEDLKSMIETAQISPEEIRFFVGYSGWSRSQLLSEIHEKSWIITQSTPNLVFFEDPQLLWQQVLKNMGNQYSVLANFPEDPSLN